MKIITKIILTLIISTTFFFVEWKIWHFFQHELKMHDPSETAARRIYILVVVLAITVTFIAGTLILNILKPKIKGTTNGKK